MSVTCFEGISTNPEILAIADRVFYTVRLSIQRGSDVLNNAPSANLPSKGIETSAHNFLKSYQSLNRPGVLRLAGLSRAGGGRFDVTAPRPVREVSNISFTSNQSVLEQARSGKLFEGLKLSNRTIGEVKYDAATKKFVVPADSKAYAKLILQAMAFKKLLPSGPPTAPAPTAPNAKELHLKLARLQAIRRFGWEITDFGNDAISCGGDGVDSVQQHVTAPAFFINEFKRDGENFDIKPDRTFVKFDLNRIGPWPRFYIANVFIAEKDASNGFVEFLQKLWDAIGDEVVTLATSLAVAATGAAIGAVVGTEIMPLVGTIVGGIVGAVIGLVVGWMLDSLKDDLFESPDNPLGMALPTQNSLFPGENKKSPIYTQDFNLGSARYLASYYWELVY